MTGFTVPNAKEFGVSIQSLDQAEPDSLDFDILGNGRYAVLSGFSTTFNSTGNGTAIVATGEVLIDGVYGSVAGDTLSFTAAGADPRFDLVVAQNSSTIIRSGTSTPPSVGVDGDLYIRTGDTPASGQSSLYVRHTGVWQNLGVYTVASDAPLNPFLLVGL